MSAIQQLPMQPQKMGLRRGLLTGRRVLSAGSGPDSPEDSSWRIEWKRQGFKVVRLDIDPRNHPHICASMTAMGEIGTYEVVYCSHAMEHLYPHEVPKALSEFYRVLEPEGHVIILVPDLEGVQPTEDPLNMTETLGDGTVRTACAGNGGLITGLHLYYGDASQIEQYPFMAHHCGFVQKTLGAAMVAAGFRCVEVKRIAAYNLIATGRKL